MVQIFKNTKFDFLRHGKAAVGVSAAFIVLSVIMLAVNGGFNMSIDFAGGTALQVMFDKPVQPGELPKIREAVSALGFGTPEIKTSRQTGGANANDAAANASADAAASQGGAAGDNVIQITVRNIEDGANVRTAIEGAIAAALPDNGFTVLSSDVVGPKIGSELTRDAVIVALLALLVILSYVGLRFKLSYAVSAVIPLGINVLIIIGVFAIFRLELTLPFLAAVLTVIGYALNDCIVVFDRVRENLKSGLKGRRFDDVLNASINQTLSRTVVTSVTTLFTVGALYALGSDSIRDFALALGIGIIVGTLSTMFIASFILARWNKKWAIVK